MTRLSKKYEIPYHGRRCTRCGTFWTGCSATTSGVSTSNVPLDTKVTQPARATASRKMSMRSARQTSSTAVKVTSAVPAKFT